MKERLVSFLRWTERYTKTDMVYLASGGFWLILGQIGAALLVLATATAFGHYATQDTYGNYKYVLSLAGIFTAFSLAGIGTAITQSTARGYEGSLAQGLKLSLRWSLGLIVLSLATAFYYFHFEHNLFLAVALLIVAFFLPFMNGYSLFSAFLSGKKQFVRVSTYTFVNALIPAACVIIALFFTHRAIVLVAVYFVTNAVADLAFYLLTQRLVRNRDIDPEMLAYSQHLSVMGLIAALADKIDSIIVFSLLGPASLAVYAYAVAIPEQIKTVAKSVGVLSLPKFAARPLEEIRASIWRRLLVLSLVIGVMSLVYILLAPPIFRLLFPIYLEAVPYSQWYAPIMVLASITAVVASLLQAQKQTRALYLVNNVGPIVLIVITIPLVYWYGIFGAIIAQALFRLVSAGVSLWQLRTI